MQTARRGTTCATAAMTAASVVKAAGSSVWPAMNSAASTPPGTIPNSRIRASTSRAVDMSFCMAGTQTVGLAGAASASEDVGERGKT